MTSIVQKKGSVVWITGLSGAGKTTFMHQLAEELKHKKIKVICLDGDALRHVLNLSDTFYSREDRLSLGYVYAKLSKYLAEQGHVVLIATIALFHELQSWNRTNLNNYIEVFIDTPDSEIKRRDSKQLQTRHQTGKLSNLVGGDIVPEFPLDPDYIVKFEPDTKNLNINLICSRLEGVQN